MLRAALLTLCVCGSLACEGLALMVQSWTVFFLAVFSQVLNILFLNLVEIPHMQALYAVWLLSNLLSDI